MVASNGTRNARWCRSTATAVDHEFPGNGNRCSHGDLVVNPVLNDSAYGKIIKWKQEGEGLRRFRLDLQIPDFVKYAESFGAHGYRPQSNDEFENMLNIALNSKGEPRSIAVDYSMSHLISNVLLKKAKMVFSNAEPETVENDMSKQQVSNPLTIARLAKIPRQCRAGAQVTAIADGVS